MKKYTLSIFAIAFFLIVNTSYFWEVTIGAAMLPVFFFGSIIFVVITLCFVLTLYFSIKEKFSIRHRTINMIFLALTICTTAIWPKGIIDFTRFERPDVLVVRIIGAANCTTLMRFKKEGDYVSQSYCFGKQESWGKYLLQNDTIHFLKESDDGTITPGESFAVLEACEHDEKTMCTMTIYANRQDTIGRCTFGVVKYEME